ncbi:MAG: hypothetical protein LQ339_002925 [Xanthoria mediterranea]|nr:MAG: hypothetical protein LQ339_002925 [Xanthoria mediterranea]
MSGLSGFPCLKFQLRSALKPTGKPLTRGDPFDGFYVDWFVPPPKVVSGRLEEFTYEDFDKWIKDASPEIMALPQIQDKNKNLSADAVVVSCKLPKGIMKAFTKTQGLSGKVPREFSDAANDFIKRRDSKTNWFILMPKDVTIKREMIPSHPGRERHSLQVFMGITAVRESHFIQATHNEFEDIELKCFVKSLQFLSYGGQITNRYVRMPYSENRQVAPEVNTKVSIEWLRGSGHQHPPEERKHQLASGFTVQRHPQQLIATAADFCILVQHDAGQKKPMTHEHLDRDDKKTVWARLTIYFDETLAQNQLDAVNNCCTSHLEPVKRLRSLMQAHKLYRYKFDVRGPTIGPDEQQAWEDHIQRLGRRLNPSQFQIISKMSDIEDGVMVVEGPPGTG